MGFFDRGVINDKWSSRVLWLTAFGSAVGMQLPMHNLWILILFYVEYDSYLARESCLRFVCLYIMFYLSEIASYLLNTFLKTNNIF